ncbi:MAG: A24 family peptidase [Bacillota bacterium]
MIGEGDGVVELACVLLVGAVCSVSDLSSRRIPNAVTLPACAVGLVLGVVRGGMEGLKSAALGGLAGFGLLFVPALLGWVGAGDAKLLAALGAFLGPAGVLEAAMCGTLAGGVAGLVALVRTRQAREGLKSLFLAGLALSSGGKAVVPEGRAAIPYGPFLALGGLVAAALRLAGLS